jgi:uncharacterized protein YjiS (DUF1127 family)
MSNVNCTHTSNDRLALRSGLTFASPVNLVRTVMQRIKDRRELNYLLGLSDYQLRDIGLQRGDIQREATKPIWRA